MFRDYTFCQIFIFIIASYFNSRCSFLTKHFHHNLMLHREHCDLFPQTTTSRCNTKNTLKALFDSVFVRYKFRFLQTVDRKIR